MRAFVNIVQTCHKVLLDTVSKMASNDKLKTALSVRCRYCIAKSVKHGVLLMFVGLCEAFNVYRSWQCNFLLVHMSSAS